ncbi:hypothetical protein [Treponema sp.]|uniref:hypothetical protein n=1 Tax=Treponema sp. TaxID=166 RepID=UPI0025EB41C4|nr:hypothetical protein [Treponema sp.]MCR5219152.1 hypothetical protein [Treponema sp.]
MNIIPSIFNQNQVNYTLIGGNVEAGKKCLPVTCILLNSHASSYRSEIFENLLSLNFERIISVEESSPMFNTDQLSHQFPQVRFMMVQDSVTTGDKINIAVAESATPFVLVLHSDLCAQKFKLNSSQLKALLKLDCFCVVPKLNNVDGNVIPVKFAPDLRKSVFEVIPELSFKDGDETLYSAEWCGLYNRQRFIRTGGFDYTITSPYWQKLDLFMRSWLWGQRTIISSYLDFTFSQEYESNEITADLSYLRFYLKNLMPVYKENGAVIPKLSFFPFNLRNKCGFTESLSQFNDARRWVSENGSCFTTDAASLVQNWNSIGE